MNPEAGLGTSHPEDHDPLPQASDRSSEVKPDPSDNAPAAGENPAMHATSRRSKTPNGKTEQDFASYRETL